MATISCDSWAIRPKQAHDLAQMVRGVINALPGKALDGYPIYRVTEFTGPGNLPDTQSQHARYTQAVSILVRGYVAEEHHLFPLHRPHRCPYQTDPCLDPSRKAASFP